VSFKDGSWQQRFGALGDEAEQVFERVARYGWVRYGLNRPPLQMHRLPARVRYTPDYLMSNKFIEVQGLGRDQKLKLKLDKHGALRWWNDLHPVELFVWDSHHHRYCYLTMNEIDGLISSGQVELDTFPEGKSYFTFEAKLLFDTSEMVGEYVPHT
jgi:hypothetical protein